MANFNLFTENNGKTRKGEKVGYYSLILHLAPSDVSGYQVCPLASAGCIATCLNTAGRGGMFKLGESTNKIQECRKRRTHLFFEQRETFMQLLERDIEHAKKRANKLGLTLVLRLNGTSDLPWEKIRPWSVGYRNIFERFPEIQFYDYTKIAARMFKQGSADFPSNYHLTFSASENNHADCKNVLQNGFNVAVVVPKALKEAIVGAVDGDETDLRFLDGSGKLVLLSAKGKAKKDTTGFVIRDHATIHNLGL